MGDEAAMGSLQLLWKKQRLFCLENTPNVAYQVYLDTNYF